MLCTIFFKYFFFTFITYNNFNNFLKGFIYINPLFSTSFNYFYTFFVSKIF